MEGRRFAGGVILAVAAVAAGAAAARAQGTQPGPPPPNGTPPQNKVPQPIVQLPGTPPGQVPPVSGTSLRQVPPDPLLPSSLGLLERAFQYMRATSPNPDRFLGGRWNPRFEQVPRFYRIDPGVPYYPYGPYPQFPGALYGGFYFGSPSYNFGSPYYNPYYPQVIREREVIVVREREPQAGPAPQGAESAPEPPGGGFYLGGRRPAQSRETLAQALDDIRKAWLNGDAERLAARFQPEGTVGVYPGGKLQYTVASGEFVAMLRDAMVRIDTLAFELSRPRADAAGRAFVTGKHTFLDAEKNRQQTHISYVLQQDGGRWVIVEAGSSSRPILRHEN